MKSKNLKSSQFYRRSGGLVMALALILACLASAAPSARALDDPALDAAAALLVDLDTGSVLYGKNETEVRAPASMVKIMTVLMGIEAYERGDLALQDLVTVNDTVFGDIGPDGSTAGFQVGEQLPFEALLYSAMLASANEGCNVIAEAVDGTIASFVARMNARAVELGCKSTNFANTHGMPNEMSYSTAYDLYLITREALTHNLFKRICTAQSYAIPVTNLSEERVVRNANNLLDPDSAYYYEYASGVKTGYTDAAGYCVIATASKDGRNLLSVILGAQSGTAADGRTEIRSYTDTKRLMNWGFDNFNYRGFDNFNYRDLLTTMKLMAEVPVKLGRGASSVVLRPEKNVVALLPNDADLDEVELDPRLFEDGALTAPVEQGTVLGEVSVSFHGQSYGTVNLIANTTVELDRGAYIGSEIRNTLRNKYVRLTITVLIILAILYVAFIVYYNVRRQSKRKVANALARQRIQEYRQAQSGTPREAAAPPRQTPQRQPSQRAGQRPTEATTGMSFEEIEALIRKRDEELKKK